MFLEAKTELEQFRNYLDDRLREAGPWPRPEEVVEQWRLENPPDESLQESVAAVGEALRSLEAGETFVPVRQFIAEFSKEIEQKRRP